MSETLQNALVVLLIAGAIGFLGTRWWLGRKRNGCGGGCGCDLAQRGPQPDFRPKETPPDQRPPTEP